MHIRRFVLLLASAAALLAEGAAASEPRRALVIGNNDYSTFPLKNSVNDASSLTVALRKLGFDVTTLRNVPDNKISETAARFLNESSAKPGTVSLLFFSGHGFQYRDRNWVTGVNVNPKNIGAGGLVDIQELLARIKPRADAVNIVILDACRSYAPDKAAENKPYSVMDAPPGTLLAFSTAPGREASDGQETETNGVYTKFLLKHMNAPGEPVESIFKRVRADVLRETEGEQVPWENSSLTRDFYFNPAPPGYSAQARAVEAAQAQRPAEIPAKSKTAAKKPAKTPAPSVLAMVESKPMPAKDKLPAIPPPVDSLSSLYLALAKIGSAGSPAAVARLAPQVSNDPYQIDSSDDPVRAANVVLKRLTGFEFSPAELKEMADNVLTVHAELAPLADWAASMFGLGNETGLMIRAIIVGGVADRAGLREGDIILKVNGKPTRTLPDIFAIASEIRPGEMVSVVAFRDGERFTSSGVVERSSIEHLVYIATSVSVRENNMERSKALLRFNSSRGHGPSQAVLAHYLFNEGSGGGGLLGIFTGKPSLYPEALALAESARQAGVSMGAHLLVLAYANGWGVPQSYAAANDLRMEWAEKQGASWAWSGLGLALLQGQGLPVHYVTARNALVRAAAQGHFDGMLGLGMIYENGYGVPRDVQAAAVWYRRAIETGNLNAIEYAEGQLRGLGLGR